MFTKSSIQKKEYSGKNTNLTIDQTEIYSGYRKVIATITEEGGIGYFKILAAGIDKKIFLDFLKELRQRMGNTPIALFMDNLSVHTGKDWEEWWEKLDILPVYNVPYSPQFSPIEAVFSKVKRLFNNNRLNCLVNKTGFNMDDAINDAFEAVTVDHCAACFRKSRHLF